MLAGRAVLVIEDVERSLGPWDFVHRPAETKHSISGAGDGPCVVIAAGARERLDRPELGRLYGERDRGPSRDERRSGHERPPRRRTPSFRPGSRRAIATAGCRS